MRRFYAPPDAFTDDGSRVALSREESRHLTSVLRLAANDEVRVFDGEGREFLCVVGADMDRGAKNATLEVRARVEPLCSESPLALTLAVALLKGEKFDLVVQKATELGVARISPVETERADVKLSRGVGRGDGGSSKEGEASKRVARWRRIAIEASKQSGRARVPEVDAPQSLTELLSRDSSFGSQVSSSGTDATARRLIFAERGGHSLVETFAAWGAKPTHVVALVGPEGGWEEAEIARALQAGWQAVTLGARVLRAETAGIVVAALLQHLCGDLV